ncbi:hypothetical protein J7K50_06475 [bacterium]|nr:hypothetical protein [bacterium]
MEEQKRKTTQTLVFILLLAIVAFVLYFNMWMPKAQKDTFIGMKDKVLGMVTGEKAAPEKTDAAVAPPADEGGKPVDVEAKPDEASPESGEEDGMVADAEGGDEGLESADVEDVSEVEEGSDKPVEEAVDDAEKPEGDSAKPKHSWLASFKGYDFKPQTHFELSPGKYFSSGKYWDDTRGKEEFLASAESAKEYVDADISDEVDKVFAGTAYFTSIGDQLRNYDLKNPFKPLILEDKDNEFGSELDVEEQIDSSGWGSGGGGYVSSSDIWSQFSDFGLPPNGETAPANGANGSVYHPGFTPDGYLIGEGMIIVRAIALSDEGESAVLEVSAGNGVKAFRVRTNQVLLGRYRVTNIYEDTVGITDIETGETFELLLGQGSRPIHGKLNDDGPAFIVNDGAG